eukprot:COSAG04_NODE_1880_length_5315_cov_3.233704_5_plen_284_part_00
MMLRRSAFSPLQLYRPMFCHLGETNSLTDHRCSANRQERRQILAWCARRSLGSVSSSPAGTAASAMSARRTSHRRAPCKSSTARYAGDHFEGKLSTDLSSPIPGPVWSSSMTVVLCGIQVQTGADPKCPMCREDIESVIRKDDKKASAKASKKKSKHKSKSAKGGGGGGGGGDGKVAAPPVGGGDGGGGGGELPYGGDMQAAMKAGDRDAIRQLMQARDGAAASGGGGGGEGPEPEPERAATPPPVGGGGGDLPYGGDMQKAMQAQDRDAIRTIMAARDKGRQ